MKEQKRKSWKSKLDDEENEAKKDLDKETAERMRQRQENLNVIKGENSWKAEKWKEKHLIKYRQLTTSTVHLHTPAYFSRQDIFIRYNHWLQKTLNAAQQTLLIKGIYSHHLF